MTYHTRLYTPDTYKDATRAREGMAGTRSSRSAAGRVLGMSTPERFSRDDLGVIMVGIAKSGPSRVRPARETARAS